MRPHNRLRGLNTAETEALLPPIASLHRPLSTSADLDPLMDKIGNAQFVLLGEASHGTAEYYQWRAAISKRLILEKGFSFIAVEGDWPDCYCVNRFIKNQPNAGTSAREVLHAFSRWPTWMWANEEIVELAEWLQRHNEQRHPAQQVGFFGLDVYSLWHSLEAVMNYLHDRDPMALAAAHRVLRCFEPYGEQGANYAHASARKIPESCEQEVVTMLRELRRQEPRYERDGREDFFTAEQNALVVQNAEAYYRTMVRGDEESWNIRDRHMVLTLERLMHFHGPQARAIVWEHNSHIGDARATDMAESGTINVGQLVREQFGDQGVVLVGFGSYRGSVIAGDEWNAPMKRMRVPPARPGSWEDLLHRAGDNDKLLLFQGNESPKMREPRGHRAIGVVYHPEFEQYGNYVPTTLPARYDAFLYLDVTHALHPLQMSVAIDEEVPETYPSGV